MNQTFYLKKFEIFWMLAKWLILLLFLAILAFLLSLALPSDLKTFLAIKIGLKVVSFWLGFLGIVSLIPIVLLVGIEWLDRIRNDKVVNTAKSFVATLQLRYFLKQNQAGHILVSATPMTVNAKTTRQFNFWTQFSAIDIRESGITIKLIMPPNQQSQHQLQAILSQVKEQLSNTHSDYYISAPTRQGHILWFHGKPRK